LFLIAVAIILRRTWRTLAVKRKDRTRNDVLILGGAAFEARTAVCAARASTASVPFGG
jgi:hypothetical protein